MKLDIQTVEHIARLARIDLDEREKEMYAEQLSQVFDYIDMLNEVDTDNVTETCQVTGLEDVVREDKVISSSEEKRNKIIDQFPEVKGDLLKVKAVFE